MKFQNYFSKTKQIISLQDAMFFGEEMKQQKKNLL